VADPPGQQRRLWRGPGRCLGRLGATGRSLAPPGLLRRGGQGSQGPHPAPPSAAPGRDAREDSEYARAGSRNLFLACAPHLGWRQIRVTAHRTALDFAHALRDLVDHQFPQATRIVLVTDNLNTPRPAALSQAFPPAEAWRILNRIEWHYPPTHGSWLTMAERAWSVLSRQCLARRIPDPATRETEVAAWVEQRNAEPVRIDWRFTQADARQRLTWLYPCHT
jgi:hypothetical protein